MKKLQYKFLSITVLMFGLAAIASAQTTYWLGSRDGYELKFDVQVPADAAAVIMYSKPALNRGADTTPRYRTFTQNVGGKAVTFHANEISWETPKLKSGGGLNEPIVGRGLAMTAITFASKGVISLPVVSTN